MSHMTVLSVNIMRNTVLLVVLFISSTLAACPDDSDLFITSPKNMEGLNGSCLQIPCNFTDKADKFDSSATLFAVWIKNHHSFRTYPENVIFTSSKTVNTYPMTVTGNLKQKDCTTLFSNLTTRYTDEYFFRIENGPFKATAICDSFRITVTDSPPSPTVEIPGDLKEGQSVTITCSASTPCPHSPPELTWTLQQDSRSTTEENTDRTLATKIQQTITLSDTHDGSVITCSARYPVNAGNDVRTAETEVTLSVSYAPKNTTASISPSDVVSAGTWVNLTCSSEAKPPVSRFTWFKSSKDGPVNVSEGDFYGFNATEGGVHYCVAINDLGNQTSSEIRLTIEGEESVSSTRWEPILVGIIVVILLVCVIIFVWWFKSKHKTQRQTQSETGEEVFAEEPARKTEEGEDDIHYGEIDFSKRIPGPSSNSVLDSREQQVTVYAQVKVNQPANSLTHTADGLEELYAQDTEEEEEADYVNRVIETRAT